MYMTSSKSCSIKANVLKASKPGICALDFHAAEKAGMWQILQGSVKIAIK
jgi:hypothetical protein